MNYKNRERKIIFNFGFSLVEVLIGIFIISLIGLAVSSFQNSVLRAERILSGSLDASYEAGKAVKILAKEIREAKIGNDGSYPILLAHENELVFFSDIDNDGRQEKIRYFLEDKRLKKQISKFSGVPPSYGSYGEAIPIINYLVNDTEPVFQYYDSNYDGSTDPLDFPVLISDIRLIRIILEINRDEGRLPMPIKAETAVMIRNLKDNR